VTREQRHFSVQKRKNTNVCDIMIFVEKISCDPKILNVSILRTTVVNVKRFLHWQSGESK